MSDHTCSYPRKKMRYGTVNTAPALRTSDAWFPKTGGVLGISMLRLYGGGQILLIRKYYPWTAFFLWALTNSKDSIIVLNK